MSQPAPSPIELPPGVVALIPMRNLVLFPNVIAPISVGRPKSMLLFGHLGVPGRRARRNRDSWSSPHLHRRPARATSCRPAPPPVRDRMEVIDLPGYTQEEKLQIAKAYLVRRQREANGLREDQCELTEEALKTIIADYTREAGVRQLEREISRAMRHCAMISRRWTMPSAGRSPDAKRQMRQRGGDRRAGDPRAVVQKRTRRARM